MSDRCSSSVISFPIWLCKIGENSSKMVGINRLKLGLGLVFTLKL